MQSLELCQKGMPVGAYPKEPIMLRSRPTLVNLAIGVDAIDPPPSTGFRDDLRTANDHQPSLQRGPVTVAEFDEVARPISLPQPASKALGTRARRKHAFILDGPTASTSELADQVKTNVRRPYVRCERLSRHKRCKHDRRLTRCVRDLLCLLRAHRFFTQFTGAHCVKVAAYVNTVSRKVGVHSARASLDVSIIIMMGCEKRTLRTCKSALAHLQMVIENAFYECK